MYLTGTKITNLKSFGTADNYLKIDRRITAIIGVNESGKSNFLELLGNIDFTKPLPSNYNNIKNLNLGEESASIDIALQFEQSEINKLQISDPQETILHLVAGSPTIIEGNLQEIIQNDELIIRSIQLFEDALKESKVDTNSKNLENYKSLLHTLKDSCHSIIDVASLNSLVHYLKSSVSRSIYQESITTAIKQLNMYYNMLPITVYRTARDMTEVKATYTNNEAEQELNDKKSPLYLLTKTAGVEISEMKKAFSLPDNDTRATTRRKILKMIRQNVCDEFKRFYNHDDYELDITFETNKLYIRVNTGDTSMAISERSNGLRWYFGLFLQVSAQDYKNRNVVYVLDEPGVFLHINAQKELIRLFGELANSKGQVIYSTHLPSMLDSENLQSVRRIEKDEEGNSHIFQTFYGKGLNNTSRQDTLAPLLQSMGCELQYAGFVSNKLNIVTEGPTDRYYIEAGLKLLEVPKSEWPSIIAAQGASTVRNIMAVLLGWGCDYKLLFDYDRAGFTEYHAITKKYGQEMGDSIFMVFPGQVPEDVNDRNVEPRTIENLLSENTNSKLSTPYDGTNETKTIAALEFRERVYNNEIEVDEETIDNFKQLFIRLLAVEDI